MYVIPLFFYSKMFGKLALRVNWNVRTRVIHPISQLMLCKSLSKRDGSKCEEVMIMLIFEIVKKRNPQIGCVINNC